LRTFPFLCCLFFRSGVFVGVFGGFVVVCCSWLIFGVVCTPMSFPCSLHLFFSLKLFFKCVYLFYLSLFLCLSVVFFISPFGLFVSQCLWTLFVCEETEWTPFLILCVFVSPSSRSFFFFLSPLSPPSLFRQVLFSPL